MAYTADQLATIIKIACKKDVIDLGEDDDQNFYIYEWINLWLFQNAKKIRKTVTSDVLAIALTGYVQFQVNSQAIDNMYEPYQVLDATDKAATKRTSFDNTSAGWYREDAYSDIHVRGLSGSYRLKYIKYPDKITLGTQFPELPPAGYHELVTWVVSKIKLTKNYLTESDMVLAQSKSTTLAAAKASMSAMGTNAQQPGIEDANLG